MGVLAKTLCIVSLFLRVSGCFFGLSMFTGGQFVTSIFQEVKAKAGICGSEAGGCKNVTVTLMHSTL